MIHSYLWLVIGQNLVTTVQSQIVLDSRTALRTDLYLDTNQLESHLIYIVLGVIYLTLRYTLFLYIGYTYHLFDIMKIFKT